jgi:NAD(P)-dependent dehydrogenase (short-subunit alcohol dehydrogenase family)
VDVGVGDDDGGWGGVVAAPAPIAPPPLSGAVPAAWTSHQSDRLSGRTALITGATSRLGQAFARSLADQGAHVYLLDDDLASLRRTAEWLGPQSHSLVLRCDLGSVDDIVGVGEFLQRTAAPISLVVHAAATDAGGTVTASPVEQLDEHYLTAVRGPYVLDQQVLPQLSRGARIVFVDPDAPVGGRGGAHRAIAGVARAVMVDELRRELGRRWISVVSLRVDTDVRAEDVVEAAMTTLGRPSGSELTEMRVGRAAPTA